MNGQQEITLKINVKDGEVVAGTASLNRMNDAAKNVGSQGSKALGDLQNNAGKLDGAISSAAKRAGVSYEEMASRVGNAGKTVKASEKNVNDLNKAIKTGSPIYKQAGDAIDRQIVAAAKRAGVSYEEMFARVQKAHSGSAKEVQAATDGAGEALAGLGAKAGPIGAVLAGVALVIAAVAAAVIQAGRMIFQASEGFAKYAMEIGKAAEETGLATETISALRNEAERSGRSIDILNGPVANFRKNIGEAAAGSKTARADLRALGLDAKTAMNDLDGAFKKVIATIVGTKDPVQQAKLAMAAFGDEGYKILPFLKEFDGDVEKAIDRARELGIEISGNQVKGAKEFTAAYNDLQKVIRGVWNEIGEKFLPVAVGAMRDLTAWVQQNKNEIVAWGTSIGNVVVYALEGFKSVIRFIQENPIVMDAIKFAFYATAPGGIIGLAAGRTPSSMRNQAALPPTEAGGSDPAALAAMLGYDPKTPKTSLSEILNAMRTGTMMQESGGNQYARNGRTNAMGLFQLMPKNIGPWTEYTLGRALSQQEFLNSPKAQEAVFNKYMGKYLEAARERSGGNDDIAIRMAAAAWYGGPGAMGRYDNAKRFRADEPSFREYTTQVLRRTRGAMGAGNVDINDVQDDIARSLREQSEALTKGEKDKVTQQIADFYFHSGLVPDKAMAERIRQLLVEKARETGEWQPGTADIIAGFNANRAARQTTEITDQGPGISTSISLPLTLDEQYVKNYREALSIDQRINALIMERRNLQAIVAEEVKSYSLSLGEAATAAEKEYQILLKRNLAAEAGNDAAFERNTLIREIGDLEKQIANIGINDGLVIQAERLRTVLELRNRELDAVIRIERAQAELAESMKVSGTQIRAQIYEHLAGQRTLNEAIADGVTQTYDELGKKLDDQIDKMFEWAGAFKSLFAEPAKAFARNGLTQITRGLLDAIAPGLGTEFTKTQNPIARPIVDKLDETNKLLSRLVGAAGGAPSMGSFSLGNILTGLFGGGGLASGGTPNFNPNVSGTGSAPSTGGGLQGLISQIFGGGSGGGGSHELGHILGGGGSSGGGLLSQITGPGGIFGAEGFGNNVGTYGAIGAGAGIIGGLIGGRAGSIIGSVGSGLAMGAQIGTMFMPGIGTAIGAAVGAVAGLLAGIFGGDPKRKRDKEEKIPALNKGFTDAMAELRKILEDVRFLRTDPDEAINRADQVRAQIASGFGVQFESKKYRQQAQSLIRSRLSEADGIIAQIKSAADIARGAADRRQRILPEFAGGHYFADFFKPNGLMPGAFDGKDNILAMISRGEMVLNPTQMGRIRSLAGYDIFAGAGIPNYPNQSSSAKLATGGVAGTGLGLAMSPNIIFQPNMALYISGVTFEENASAWLESDDGKRIFVKVYKQEKDGRRIK